MLKTGNTIVSIYTEMTPNPETMKFVANKLLYPGKSIDFPEESAAGPSPLAKELFAFPFIKSVFIASNFVTLTKTQGTNWDDVIPNIREFLKIKCEDRDRECRGRYCVPRSGEWYAIAYPTTARTRAGACSR